MIGMIVAERIDCWPEFASFEKDSTHHDYHLLHSSSAPFIRSGKPSESLGCIFKSRSVFLQFASAATS
jgi:hypothetical protein